MTQINIVIVQLIVVIKCTYVLSLFDINHQCNNLINETGHPLFQCYLLSDKYSAASIHFNTLKLPVLNVPVDIFKKYIRKATAGIYIPKQMLYKTELHPIKCLSLAENGMFFKNKCLD